MKNVLTRLFIAAALCILLITTCCGCEKKLQAGPYETEHNMKYGGVVIKGTNDELTGIGFKPGDSLDIVFSNGVTAEDVPYFTGFYCRTGELLFCMYPGDKYGRLTHNNGADFYEENGITEDCTATIRLREAGKYIKTEETMQMRYTNDRDDYSSDEIYANFRAMNGGQMKDNLFYRGASPCDNKYNRAAISSALCEKAGINYFLDLADSEEETQKYFDDADLKCDYWKESYKNGKVLELNMSASFIKQDYAQSIVKMLRLVISENGSFFIHCTEGKDRTGFSCLLVEALGKFSVEEMAEDYMKTYENYYSFTEQNEPEKYDSVMNIKFYDMLFYLTGTENPEEITSDLATAGAEKYLLEAGMSVQEIKTLEEIIRK